MNEFSKEDKTYMAEALRLAAKGLFTTAPNPNVGCVIVSHNGALVGRGYHAKAGTPHAEVHALRQAGAKAAGGTAYVTLEPCNHFGRTPPCANALIEAQVARVVVAMQDPYHEVAGRGLAKLRAAGIEVQVGLFAAQAAALNRGFIKRATQGLPYVRVKLAQSLDGRTALANGQSKWITGTEARHDVQFGRAQSASILSGAGTVMADDPLLNVRLPPIEYREGATLRRALGDSTLFAEIEPFLATVDAEAEHAEDADTIEVRQPIRVIVDNQLQLHSDLKLWQVESPVWLAVPQSVSQPVLQEGSQSVSEAAPQKGPQEVPQSVSQPVSQEAPPSFPQAVPHAEVQNNNQHNNQHNLPAQGEYLVVAADENRTRVNLTDLLRELAARGVNEVWVEAGANLAGALLTAELVDELIVYTAPKLMGPDAAGLLNLPPFISMNEVPTMRFDEVERVGDDIKIVVRVS